MIKKDIFMLCFAGIAFLALPIIAYPKIIASNPTEFPALSKFYNRESNLNSSKNDRSTKTISALELARVDRGWIVRMRKSSAYSKFSVWGILW